jgi:undecaprenyl phosphate-alpha-L-ara4N flippase subunit ArnE
MLKLVLLITLQSAALTASQVFLKMALSAFGKFQWSFAFFKTVFSNIPFALSGITGLTAIFIWVYVLKKFEFSLAYPMVSISYVFGLVSAYFIFHETITWTRWLGVAVIIAGVVLVAQK